MESTIHTIHRLGPVVTVGFQSFEDTGLVNHFFSTRQGGVSSGPYASMNLSLAYGDEPARVYENFRRILFSGNVNPNHVVFSRQVHGDCVMQVGAGDRGKGLTKPLEFEGVDALITNSRQVCLVTFHADCVPVFLLDPVKKAIGLAHAGWKGTNLKIAAKTVSAMTEAFGSRPQDILAGIGPSIGPDCYEVSEDLYHTFHRSLGDMVEYIFRPGRTDAPDGKPRYLLNLWEANRLILVEAGLSEENITVTDLCTHCHEDLFFSHRRTGLPRGSMAAFLELK